MTSSTLKGAAAPAAADELEEYLSRPSEQTIEILAGLEGDLLVLGAGGKMGFSLCSMARRAFDAAGLETRRVIAVSRFGDPTELPKFHRSSIETIAVDLLEPGTLEQLPDASSVLFLAGMKFGSRNNLPATWAMNTFLPGLAGRQFAGSRMVALSTGNVYALSPVVGGGASEYDPTDPVGEYAQSCLGRERMLAYYSAEHATPLTLIRLNYANALRYGVVTDIAGKVLSGEPVDVTMGFVNVIWQGDANAAILSAFSLCSSPPMVLNVTGPETASVTWIATRAAEFLHINAPVFIGSPAETALLSDAGRCHALFGYPTVTLDQLVEWSCSWLAAGGDLLHKPTGFQVRDGRF